MMSARRKRKALIGRKGRLTGMLVFVWAAAIACAVTPGSSGRTGSSHARGSSSTVSSASVKSDLVMVNSTLATQEEQVAGTGIVLTSNGEVITNNHVIAGSTSVKATDTGNGQTYTAHVVGYDRAHDVAVLRLQDASGLATAPLDAGSQPAVGAGVAAIGNAGGTGKLSTATGKISALDQSVVASDESSGSEQQLNGLIQVSANVQPGDSGGPLIDANGHVIGITTAAGTGFSFHSGKTGTEGFAIPIGNALLIRNMIDAGRSTGTVHVGPTAQLGVLVSGSQPGQVPDQGNGAVVVEVLPGQAAASAGLAPGDTITSLGGAAVDSPTTLASLVDRYQPGQRVTLEWSNRANQTRTEMVTLGQGPAG